MRRAGRPQSQRLTRPGGPTLWRRCATGRARRPRSQPGVVQRTDGAPATRPGARAQWPGRQHVLDLDDFSVGEIEHVFATTDGMKEILSRPIRKVPTLRGKTVVTLFYEASTRTRVSFEMAAKILGADAVNVTASGSSVTKGEPLVETIRT